MVAGCTETNSNSKDFHVLKKQLDLFIDSMGVWRSGGRLSKSDLHYSTKRLITLP